MNIQYELLPDDIATPDDLTAIAEGDEEYLRGETVPHSLINWDSTRYDT